MQPAHTFPGWTIIEKLGEGGMCAVYRARSNADPKLERAIKVLLDDEPSMEKRFIAEAELLIALDHPNVIDVFELHPGDPETEQHAWIVMELLAGRDLEEHRDHADPLGPDQVARWLADIAQGLQMVHDTGIVHRDIKPSNIMLGDDGVPRLIDFGIARDTGAAHMTRAGVVVGTASYLPPELYLEKDGNHLQDAPQSDVYALGQTLCELLINRPIHDGPKFKGPDRLVRIMNDKLKRPWLDPREWNPGVPKALAEIVIDATRQDPEQRIATARDLEARLRGFVSDRRATTHAPVNRVDVAALPPPPGSKPPQPTAARISAPPSGGGSRLGAVLGLGAVGIGLLALGVGVLVLVVVAGMMLFTLGLTASLAG